MDAEALEGSDTVSRSRFIRARAWLHQQRVQFYFQWGAEPW